MSTPPSPTNCFRWILHGIFQLDQCIVDPDQSLQRKQNVCLSPVPAGVTVVSSKSEVMATTLLVEWMFCCF
jgi:hypothetical protein